MHNPKKCVLINAIQSVVTSVVSGISQGYVPGPLVFRVYANNIASTLTCRRRLYAEYSVICHGVKRLDDVGYLLRDLSHMQALWVKRKITLKAAKFQQVSFKRIRRPILSKYSGTYAS